MEAEFNVPDWNEIITVLRLEAGRMMENTSDDLARAVPRDQNSIVALSGDAREAANDIRLLLAAAEVLCRRSLITQDQD